LVERNAVEQDLHVLDRVDRHAGLADVAGHARMVGIVAAVGGEVERHRHALPAGGERLPSKAVEASAVENPAYWRMVHGLTAYIVGCGPRRKGSKPGSVSVCARPSVSALVYSGLTLRPSGVIQLSFSTSPPGECLAAIFFQASMSGWG